MNLKSASLVLIFGSLALAQAPEYPIIPGGGGAPTGTAGGALTGTYPNPGIDPSQVQSIAGGKGWLRDGTLTAEYLGPNVSGATWTDTSGNGNNGTITGATWTNSQYLTFSGTSQFVSIPKAVCTGAGAMQFWFRRRQHSTASGVQSETTSIILGPDSGNYLGFPGSQMGEAGFTNGGTPQTQTLEKFVGNTSLTVTIGSPYLTYRDGYPGAVLSTTNQAALTASSTCYIGSWAAASAYGFGGDIYAALFYSSAPSAAQIAKNEAAMRTYLLSQIGVSFSEQVNYEGPQLFAIGDSITAGNGVSGSLFKSLLYYTDQKLSPKYEIWNMGLAGDTCQSIATRITTNLNPLAWRSGNPGSNVVLVECGTNDIFTNNATAATVFGYWQSICAAVHGFQSKCVVATIMGSPKQSGAQNTQRIAANALAVAGMLSGSLGADGLADWGTDPIMGSYTNMLDTFYSDGLVHPKDGGNQIIGPYSARAVKYAAGLSNETFVQKLTVPRGNLSGTSATTGSVPLLQLMTNEKVCGVTIKHTSPNKGPTALTMTLSVGDSLGTTTQYAPAFNILQTPSSTAFQDTTAWGSASTAGGVVTAYYTSTIGNVNDAYTDLAVDGVTNTKVTSASYTFVAADVGTDFYISAGTGFTVGLYHINSVAAGAATLDRSPAAVSTTGGSFILGETNIDVCIVSIP